MGKRIPMPAWPALLFLPLAAMAADPARTQAVPELPLGILARPLPRGEETGRVILQHGADEVPVYVRSVQPDSVDGYRGRCTRRPAADARRLRRGR